MEKEAFYFPHFCNARHDRKIRRLRKELGVEGYGIYFMLLETLREQQDLMYPLSDLDLLAEEFGVSEAKIQVTVNNYELFEIDQERKFFSPKMLVYLEPYFRMKAQRKLAGQRSAEARSSNDRSTTVEQKKEKEKKEKEIKVNTISFIDSVLEFQPLLGNEYNNFISYWTEKNNKGKERWEMEKFFDMKRRINTWMTNATKFNQNGTATEKRGTSIDRIEAISRW